MVFEILSGNLWSNRMLQLSWQLLFQSFLTQEFQLTYHSTEEQKLDESQWPFG
uniref:Uncharacterized protein n=1 Tax=Rhizophora mucronata TaxID=61149 RepID=A0A2P2JZF3_RHIMU